MRTDRDGTDAPDPGEKLWLDTDDLQQRLRVLIAWAESPAINNPRVSNPIREALDRIRELEAERDEAYMAANAGLEALRRVQVEVAKMKQLIMPEVAQRAAAAGGVAPTDSALRAENERLREALTDEISELENSFGHGAWQDGKIRDRIAYLRTALTGGS